MNPASAIRRSGSLAITLGSIVVAALVGFVGLRAIPISYFSGELLLLLGIGIMVALLMFIVLAWSRARASDAHRYLPLALWWILLSSEQFFPRRGVGGDRAIEGEFALGAYAEAALWMALLASVVLIALRDSSVTQRLFSSPFRWAGVFALLCVASAPLSPTPAFAFIWALKLLLGVILVGAVCRHSTPAAARGCLGATFAAFLFLTTMALLQAFTGPAPFDGGRLDALVSPVTVAGWSAVLFLLALGLRVLGGGRGYLAVAIAAPAIMLLAMGKAAILACMLSTFIFFVLRKRPGVAFGTLAGVALIAVAVVAFSPVSSYLDAYSESGYAGTLTGRVDLWTVALDEIRNSPLLGHGYMSSRYVGLAVDSWDAGHLHNAYLEVAYNNGLLGLLLIIGINFLLLRSLFRLLRHGASGELRSLAAVLICLHSFLLLTSITEASFGGRPSAFFLLFLVLFGLSVALTETQTAYSSLLSRPYDVQTQAAAPSSDSLLADPFLAPLPLRRRGEER